MQRTLLMLQVVQAPDQQRSKAIRSDPSFGLPGPEFLPGQITY